jgi:hypothetical protein
MWALMIGVMAIVFHYIPLDHLDQIAYHRSRYAFCEFRKYGTGVRWTIALIIAKTKIVLRESYASLMI